MTSDTAGSGAEMGTGAGQGKKIKEEGPLEVCLRNNPHFPSQGKKREKLWLHLHERFHFWRSNGEGLGTGAPRMIENKRTHRG